MLDAIPTIEKGILQPALANIERSVLINLLVGNLGRQIHQKFVTVVIKCLTGIIRTEFDTRLTNARVSCPIQFNIHIDARLSLR